MCMLTLQLINSLPDREFINHKKFDLINFKGLELSSKVVSLEEEAPRVLQG